jgi:UDP-glucose:glycoprotein glucosyltransferase
VQCNNPQTHEPKLLRAKRIIPEWTEYDNEVAALAKRVADRTHESVAFGGEAGELAQVKLQEEDFQKASPNRAKSEL